MWRWAHGMLMRLPSRRMHACWGCVTHPFVWRTFGRPVVFPLLCALWAGETADSSPDTGPERAFSAGVALAVGRLLLGRRVCVTGQQSHIRIKIRYQPYFPEEAHGGAWGGKPRVHARCCIGCPGPYRYMHQQKNFTAITFGTVKERLVSR